MTEAPDGQIQDTVPPGEDQPKPRLAKALAAFQAEIPRIEKTSKADIRPRDSAPYSYDYAELGAVTEVSMPLLGKHGLSFLAKPTWVRWPDMQPMFALVYKLMHESGEQEVGIWPLPPPAQAGAQQLGSAISYARRYAFQAVTGVAPAPGEDDDAAKAQDGPRPERPEPVEPQMADAGQKRRIRNRLTEMGVDDDPDTRMAWVTGLRGVHTENLDELTRQDAAEVLDMLRPADRRARTDVIEALSSIGVTDKDDVLARLTEWTGRALSGTDGLIMAEAVAVRSKAAGIYYQENVTAAAGEGSQEVLPDDHAAG
jgi:hypothetical protein